MIFALVTIALLIQALGLCALLVNMHRAAEGHEDGAGYHTIATTLDKAYCDAFTGPPFRVTPILAKATPRQVTRGLEFLSAGQA